MCELREIIELPDETSEAQRAVASAQYRLLQMLQRRMFDGAPPEDELSRLEHENRRLRAILDAVARAGLGRGALIEFSVEGGSTYVVVCRADMDEPAFVQSMIDGLRGLLDAVGIDVPDTDKWQRTGVTADGAQDDGAER